MPPNELQVTFDDEQEISGMTLPGQVDDETALSSQYDDEREQRLMIFHKRVVQMAEREDLSSKIVGEAIALAQDPRLPRRAVIFAAPAGEYGPPQLPPEGLGAAIEAYLSSLHEMAVARRTHSGITISEAVRDAFDNVVSAAAKLNDLGWPVNWAQSVRSILEFSEIGLQDGKLVHCYDDIDDQTTLRRRLDLIGWPTFNVVIRDNVKNTRKIRKLNLTGKDRERYEDTPLHRNRGENKIPKSFMYTSNWIDQDGTGKSVLVYV